MGNREYDYSLLFVLGVSLLLSLAFCGPYDQMVNDKEFFKYAGMAVLRGEVPYRDFFDHKPPMIYFINALGLLPGLGSWGLWLITTGFALVITFLLFRLGREYRLAYPWLVPLLFNLMLRDNLITQGINYTREYSTYFVLLFFCVLMGKYRYRHFLLGLFTALTFFTQQDQVLSLLPFLIYVLLTENTPSALARITRLAAGFLSVTLLFVLYFALHRSLGYWWEDAYGFNFSVYIREPKSLGDHFRSIKRVLDAGNYELPFMAVLALGITSLFLPHRKKGLVIAGLAALFLSMSSELLGGRLLGRETSFDFTYYFLPLSGTVCILLFIVFAFTESDVLTGRVAQLPYALLLCTSLSYTALQHAANLQRRDEQPEMRTPELAYLRQQKLTDYQFCALFNDDYTYYYNELKILSPSRWIYQHFWWWYARWDPDHRIMGSIAQDLLRHKTTYIIIGPRYFDLVKNPASKEWWNAFIQAHYQRVSIPGSQQSYLWKWKDTIPAPVP